jgi:hypothetical protein
VNNHGFLNLTLHGGGQGFDSPRLHSENSGRCRNNIRQVSPLLAKLLCSNRRLVRN